MSNCLCLVTAFYISCIPSTLYVCQVKHQSYCPAPGYTAIIEREFVALREAGLHALREYISRNDQSR